jgi:hypothetical protein
VWLLDAHYRASLCLRESPILDKTVDLKREASLELFARGVGKAEDKNETVTKPVSIRQNEV